MLDEGENLILQDKLLTKSRKIVNLANSNKIIKFCIIANYCNERKYHVVWYDIIYRRVKNDKISKEG